RRIHDPEAAVVRQIFEMAATGRGLRGITHALNARAVPPPDTRLRRELRGQPSCRSWDPGTVRAILERPLYHGRLVYNRSRKRNGDGEIAQKPRPESEWLFVDVPHLRIVPEDLAATVAAIRTD